MVTQPIFEMEGGMPDYATLRTKDLSEEALSADNVRGNARAKAVRASYEFWSTGDEPSSSKPSLRSLPSTPYGRCARRA
jgi:hypothetical protein